MGLFGNKKEEPKKVVEAPSIYKTTDDQGNLVFKSGNRVLIIQKPFNLEGVNNLYNCCAYQYEISIWDGINNKDSVLFRELILGVDKDRMVKDQAYAKFVLDHVVSQKRIAELQKAEFAQNDDPKFGNYVGTVTIEEDGIGIIMDPKVGAIVSALPHVKDIHRKHDEDERTKILETIEYNNQHIAKAEQKIADAQLEKEEYMRRNVELTAKLEENEKRHGK